MTHKELLKLFAEHDIDFVVVGGVALRLYNSPRVTHDIDQAGQWVEHTKSGSLSFVALHSEPQQSEVLMQTVDISSQVDVLFELGIPIMRLKENARLIHLQDIYFHVAAIDDLIKLKEQRSDKSWTDEQDIRYLKSLKDT